RHAHRQVLRWHRPEGLAPVPHPQAHGAGRGPGPAGPLWGLRPPAWAHRGGRRLRLARRPGAGQLRDRRGHPRRAGPAERAVRALGAHARGARRARRAVPAGAEGRAVLVEAPGTTVVEALMWLLAIAVVAMLVVALVSLS